MNKFFTTLQLIYLFAICALAENDYLTNADYLQGLTKDAFVSTSQWDEIYTTIKNIEDNSFQCFARLQDLDVFVNTEGHSDQSIICELENLSIEYSSLSRRIKSLENIARKSVSFQSAQDRAQGLYAFQSDLEELENNFINFKNYVNAYFRYVVSSRGKWLLLKEDYLAGTNNTLTADFVASQYSLLIGQSFALKERGYIDYIKIRFPLGQHPSPDKVFLTQYHSTISTNNFIYSCAVSTNEAPIYTYFFDCPIFSKDILLIFGIKGFQNLLQNIYVCNNSYNYDLGILFTANIPRINNSPSSYTLSGDSTRDLCFDIGFKRGTNIVLGVDGIEINNEAELKINGKRVLNIEEIESMIDESIGSLSVVISNFVINSSSIADNAIINSKIADAAVTGDKIADFSITTNKLLDGVVTAIKIADGAVIGSKLADSAITSNKIANSSVTNEKLANGVIDDSKLADNAVARSKIVDGAIDDSKLANGAVTRAKIANSAVDDSKLETGAVTRAKIANNAVDDSKLDTGAVTRAKIANSAVDDSKLDTGAVTRAKIANSAIDDSKLDTGAVTREKIANSAVDVSKLADGAVISSKILSNSVDKVHFSNNLKQYLITSDGGTITGSLTVAKMIFDSDADWRIGTPSVCSDIILLNSNSRIRSNEGSLKLSAPQNENISAESFLSFDSIGQAGIVTIPAGETSVNVSCANITPQAIVMLTPRQILTNVWWSVQNNQNSSNFTVKITRDCHESVSFNYLIIRK